MTNRDRVCRVHAAEGRLVDIGDFFHAWAVDVRGAGPVAWRFLQRSLAQKYRFSSLGLAWAVLPAAMTALVLIGGQRMHTLATGDSGVPAAFYGIFGLIIAQPFLEAFQETRRLFVNNRHMLRRQKMPIEGLITAILLEVFFNTAVRLLVVAGVFFLFAVPPVVATLPLALWGIGGVILAGAGLGLMLAPASVLKPDIENAMIALPWLLFAVTPVFIIPAAGSALAMIQQTNPLGWLFDSIRTAAYGADGSLVGAAAGPVAGLLILMIGWFFCRLARPHVIERMLV
jgi:lipopolysaccharide transport system permease protein